MKFWKAALTAAIGVFGLLIGIGIGAVATAIHPVLGLCYILFLLYVLIFMSLYEH